MQQKIDVRGHWEQRWHPLRQEWIVYAAHRNARPWLGLTEEHQSNTPAYDPECYLCPRNKRHNGKINPDYKDTFIFDNDHPVVGDGAPDVSISDDPLFRKRRASGIARVVCYDPRHNITLTDMSFPEATAVFLALRTQMQEFRQNPEIQFVLIFENKGEIVGTSNQHPHCQIYATNFTFKNIEQELAASEAYRHDHRGNIFQSILDFEQKDGARIIAENEHAIAFVPFFAQYAYEVWIFPKKRHATLATQSDEELAGLVAAYQHVTRRYDRLFNMPFPYVMPFYQAPVDDRDYGDYHMHLVLLPPLRQPGIKKFLAGPEIGGGNFMADTIPEEKAAELQKIILED